MPTLKARIFTSDPEQANALSHDLAQEGYEVEVLSAEEFPDASADLEVYLEACAEADVMRRAAELAADLGVDVAIATGSLFIPEPLRAEQPATALAPDAAIEQPVLASAGLALPQHAPPQGANAGSVGDPKAPTPVAANSNRQAKEGRRAEPHQGSLPGFWKRAIPATTVILAGWATAVRETMASSRDAVREYRERALFRVARARAQREEHLLELLRQRTEAQQRVSLLEAQREKAVAYLRQLENESAGFLSSTQEPPPADVSIPRRLQQFVARARALRWEAVLAGVASAGAVFAIGLAVASFTPQPVPSGAAAANPAAAAPEPALAKPVERPSPAVRAEPAPRRRTRHAAPAEANDDAVAGDVTIHRFAKPTPTPRTQAQGWKHFSDLDNH